MTKLEKLTALLDYVSSSDELTLFVEHEIELLKKKSSHKSEKLTAEQEIVLEDVSGAVAQAEGSTCSELAALLDHKYTPQKVSAYLTKLIKSGVVRKETEKKVSRFYLATVEE